MSLRLHPGIAAAIAEGATLLTPNQRAAHGIRRRFDELQREAGLELWTPAKVRPLEGWLAGEWQERLLAGADDRVLLNRTQQHVLWREIVAADPETSRLRSADALADLAARAWSLLHLYNGRARLREWPASTDSAAFERWAAAFERRLSRGRWITAPQLPAQLPASFPSAGALALVDFDQPAPAVQSLFEALERRGVQLTRVDTGIQAAQSRIYKADDDAAELTAAATWARDLTRANPGARVAIVVPDLGERRAAIERVFPAILSREPFAAGDAPEYEFSLGKPLGGLAIATTALDLLAWTLDALPLESISGLLLSPWFTAAEPAVAEFDAFELRRSAMLRPQLSLEAAIALVRRSGRELGDLLQRMRSLQKAAREIQLSQSSAHLVPQQTSFARWAEIFRTVLEAAGWTERAGASSLFFQQHARFENALDELATLDFSGHRPEAGQALDMLRAILRQTIFAPESKGAAIQILGPFELGGVDFDALWFAGADDLGWPAAAATNPLLPWAMQRALAMPGADRERDDAAAHTLTGRVARSAREVVFSYAQAFEGGQRRPSPLLAELDLQPLEGRSTPDAEPPRKLETVADHVRLPELPPGPVRGGAQILKLQAACAFRAFAEKRLRSSEPDSQAAGLDAMERGTVVHTVMQSFWTAVQSQEALRLLSTAECSAHLDLAIRQGFLNVRPRDAWEEAYLTVQKQRLRDLLWPWLSLETERPEFTVQTPEQEKRLQLGPLELSLRIDRIDTTASGDLILDYKTGKATPAQWKSARPDEPQLPLYTLLARREGRRLAGVAFAVLRPGKGLNLAGYADDDQVFGKTTPMTAATLEEQVDEWEEILMRLAEAYAGGDTRVLPKSYPKTCEHCGQRILCRLNPELLPDWAEDDQEFEGEPALG